MQEAVRALRITPRHIRTERGFNEFGDLDRDEVARDLIEFCQDRGTFNDFIREEFVRLGAGISYLHKAEVEHWISRTARGTYEFDIDFLRRAYRAGKRAWLQDLVQSA